MLLYAHRGARAERPENTMLAFRHALDLGADALELDVHRTRDGVVVVHHDDTLLRSAGIGRRVADTDYETLSQIDVGYVFRDAQGKAPHTARIPRLEELLVEMPGIPLNIDLKVLDPRLVDGVLALLRRHGAQAHVRLASFSSRVMALVHRAGYEGATSFGPNGVLALALGGGRWLRGAEARASAAQVPLRHGPLRFDTPRFLAAVQARGAQAHFWTINDPEEAKRLQVLGADAVVSDDVRALRAVLPRAAG